MTTPEVEVQDLLNAQTGKIAWSELARHFARGVVIRVSSEQDLLEVAESLIQDRASDVERMYEQGWLERKE